MTQNDGLSHLDHSDYCRLSIDVQSPLSDTCVLAEENSSSCLISNLHGLGGQIWALGVNFPAEFDFFTKNDQKHQFKAVL